jgi:hypothetical protein
MIFTSVVQFQVWDSWLFRQKIFIKKDKFIKIFSAGNLEVEKIWCDQYLFGVILRYYFSWPQPPIMLFLGTDAQN